MGKHALQVMQCVLSLPTNGIHLSGTQGEHTLRLKALHLHEVQSLFKEEAHLCNVEQL
jgi:hypothetical protein